MSTHALRTSRPAVPLRYLDLAVLALALPIFIAAGLPLLGWVAAGGAWLVQRIVRELLIRRAAASGDPKTVAGLLTASMIARGWLVAGSVFAAGLAEREAGLSAAVLVIALFTIMFTTAMVERPFERGGRR